MSGGGFDALTGAGTGSPEGPDPAPPPAGIRTVGERGPATTRIVLVRHGEAVCNVTGVCGGPVGCEGLTDRGRAQVGVLAARLAETGELAGADALYSSVLPRAVETAELLAPALVGPDGRGPGAPVQECGFCELHCGEADGLDWTAFSHRFGNPDWDTDPDRPIAPGGESWTGFVRRVSDALDGAAGRHPGQLVVVACHAGVVEASLLAKLPVVGGLEGTRMKLRTLHASLTTWDVDAGTWTLVGYNDGAHHLAPGAVGGPPTQVTESGRSWMTVGSGVPGDARATGAPDDPGASSAQQA